MSQPSSVASRDFDYDLFVVGGGSGGIRAARVAAAAGARVAVAEEKYLGGTCVNVGCVPKKIFMYGAEYASHFRQAKAFGWDLSVHGFDWKGFIAHKNAEIQRLNDIYRSLLVNSKVDLYMGRATILGSHDVTVLGKRLSAKNILIAVGGRPYKPDIPGIEHSITSDDFFFLEKLPRRALVVGGGYIAVELASILSGFGAETVLAYRGDKLLRDFDEGIREHLTQEIKERSSIDLRLRANVERILPDNQSGYRALLANGEELAADCILYATGRYPNVGGFGLENTGVTFSQQGFIDVDVCYRTRDPNIFAIGDVVGYSQLTPVALAEGTAVARYLFDKDAFHPVAYTAIPTAVFCTPSIGTVGLSEQLAEKHGYNVWIYESKFRPMRSAFSGDQAQAFMKLVVDANTDKVLGAHMVGPDAAEIIQGLAIAMNKGATKRDFDLTIGVHPSAAEEFVTMRQVVRETQPKHPHLEGTPP